MWESVRQALAPQPMQIIDQTADTLTLRDRRPIPLGWLLATGVLLFALVVALLSPSLLIGQRVGLVAFAAGVSVVLLLSARSTVATFDRANDAIVIHQTGLRGMQTTKHNLREIVDVLPGQVGGEGVPDSYRVELVLESGISLLLSWYASDDGQDAARLAALVTAIRGFLELPV